MEFVNRCLDAKGATTDEERDGMVGECCGEEEAIRHCPPDSSCWYKELSRDSEFDLKRKEKLRQKQWNGKHCH